MERNLERERVVATNNNIALHAKRKELKEALDLFEELKLDKLGTRMIGIHMCTIV